MEARRRPPAPAPAELPAIPAKRGCQAIGDGTRTAEGLPRGFLHQPLEPDRPCASTLLNTVLGIKLTRVTGFELTQDGLVCDVEPTTEIPCCGGCGRRVRKVYDQRKARLWRHLDLAGMSLELRCAPPGATVGAIIGRVVERMLPGDRLACAYLLKESFAAILDRRQPNVVLMKLEEWISWAKHSGLEPFARVARTIA